MIRYAAVLLVALSISLVGLAATACSGSSTDEAATPTPQSSGNVETVGTVEGVAGGVLTVTTSGGTVSVVVGDDTSIQKLCTGSLTDIAAGEYISVMGTADESGDIQAATISVGTSSMTSQFGRPGDMAPGSAPSGTPGDPGGIPGGPDGTPYPGATQLPGGLGGFGGFPDGGGTSGTVQTIEGNVLTVATGEGTVTVVVSEETQVQTTCVGSLDDIAAGTMVTVSGSQQEDGSIDAASIFLTEGFSQP